MSWTGRTDKGSPGLFKRWAGGVSYGARGALGEEGIRRSLGLGKEAWAKSKLKTCPRCLERSMVHEFGLYRCTRDDICGFEGTKDEVQAFVQRTVVDPRVITVAKGFEGNFSQRAKGMAMVSRLMWLLTFLIFIYAGTWLVEGRLITGAWAMLVAGVCGVQALRYAFMTRRVRDPGERSVRAFFLSPSKWVV